ncbi:NAD(P)H-binding protein [Stutzerimonas urumqiensis]|uniref:NAD(P)H-binding protein n=1 Tax=Stutzerimonas urumqiensis TaxID=638269 RepID=UPI003BA9A7B2
MRESCVVIAGCGDLGCRLGERLATQGAEVHGLRRDVSRLPACIRPLPGDLGHAQVPADWPQRVDFLVYAASANRHDESGYREAYVEGLEHVLGWLAQRGQRPRRLLFVSSTGVYGQHEGEWVDESSPTEPRGYTGQVMLEAERRALASGLPATVVRMAGLYHPDRPWLQSQVREGLQVDRDPPQYANRIHRDDAASLLAFLLHAEISGQALDDCYLGVDDDPAPLAEVVDWLRERLGVTHWSEQRMTRRAGSKRCSNARARALGWVPAYPSYRDGYAALGEPVA